MEDRMFWLEILTVFFVSISRIVRFLILWKNLPILGIFPDFEYFPWILFPENVFPKIFCLIQHFLDLLLFLSQERERKKGRNKRRKRWLWSLSQREKFFSYSKQFIKEIVSSSSLLYLYFLLSSFHVSKLWRKRKRNRRERAKEFFLVGNFVSKKKKFQLNQQNETFLNFLSLSLWKFESEKERKKERGRDECQPFSSAIF